MKYQAVERAIGDPHDVFPNGYTGPAMRSSRSHEAWDANIMTANSNRHATESNQVRRVTAGKIQSNIQLIAAVRADFRADLQRILDGGVLGTHLEALLESRGCGKPNVKELFQYGMSRLPPDAGRPDDSLAAYFIILSELCHRSMDLRNFAAECTEYCESEALDGWSRSLEELNAAYEMLTSQFDQA